MNTVYKYAEILGESVIAENREEGSFIWENYYDSEDRLNEYDLTLYVREADGRYSRYEETHFQRAYETETVLGAPGESRLPGGEASGRGDGGEAPAGDGADLYRGPEGLGKDVEKKMKIKMKIKIKEQLCQITL